MAYQALAAVLGGTQSLHTNARDEALALPTQESAETALRTQQILANETGVADTVDPLAGSYYVEELTNQLEKKAMEYIEKVDALGGSIPAIEQRYFQKEIESSAYAYQKELESGEQIVVGVNKYKQGQESAPALLKIDPKGEQEQTARLQDLRKRRDSQKVSACLSALKEAAQGSENLLPLIKDCVTHLATVGEISHTLREVFGTYHETF